METLTYCGELTVCTCWCGLRHAIPVELHNEQIRQREEGLKQTGIYCPVGHSYVSAGESKVAKLQRELNATIARNDQTISLLRENVRHAENQVKAERAAKSRIKNRVAHGVCPCCNRSFPNDKMQRHIKTKHPDFSKVEK